MGKTTDRYIQTGSTGLGTVKVQPNLIALGALGVNDPEEETGGQAPIAPNGGALPI